MMKKPLLPEDEVLFLSHLPQGELESRVLALWEAGWSLSSIGESLDPMRPKTTVHFWVKKAETRDQRRKIPTPPPKSLTTSVPTKNAPRKRSISPNVPPDMKSHLHALSIQARRYRAKTPPGSPLAIANDELTTVAKTLRGMGVPTAAIAEAAGVSYRAMARRLAK